MISFVLFDFVVRHLMQEDRRLRFVLLLPIFPRIVCRTDVVDDDPINLRADLLPRRSGRKGTQACIVPRPPLAQTANIVLSLEHAMSSIFAEFRARYRRRLQDASRGISCANR